MSLLKTYEQKKNQEVLRHYEKNIKVIENIQSQTTNFQNNFWLEFFNQSATYILTAVKLERELNEDYFQTKSLQEMQVYNYTLHKDKILEIYESSFANPAYSVKCFKDKFGQLNSILYLYIISLGKLAHEHLIYKIDSINQLFIDYYNIYHKHGADYDKLLLALKKYVVANRYDNLCWGYLKRFSPDFDFYTNWVKNADLNDLRYLYYYGNYVSEDELKTAEFLNTLPEEKIEYVMKQTAKAYIDSFAESNKDYTQKKTVFLIFRLGMERLARCLMTEMENKYNLKVCIANVQSGIYDQQMQYDHRFDSALYLCDYYKDTYLAELEKCCEELKDIISIASGGIYFDPFGEPPFAPENKPECLKFDEQQMALNQEISAKSSMIFSKYYKRSENSFCIIGFPTPAIGENFPEIFDKTIEINMLDHDHWQKIQQCLIDALDQADKVHVKGCGNNKTDIIIKMPKINNPDKETNFANCGATVNIPVGEVFNTPQLTGTNGLLHISETFLRNLCYKELEIEFKDGRISNYDCKNYDTEEANKKYIEENLIFPHKSLPLGEFAIGTNTLAYSVAQKYNILSVLPILIIEKMGPHFAIGDTCYSREEDTPVFNPDGKEIISRDNEQSILRKEDPVKAYLQVHVDITLPYEEIGHITAITSDDRKIDIIRNGRFVLTGTEELNEYLDNG